MENERNQNPQRQLAIEWWNELEYPKRLEYWREYCIHFTPSASPDDLTGREIQNIWAVKAAKYNGKVFKTGNDDLFKAYINKFSQEYKAQMLQILINDLGIRELVDESLRSH